MHFYSFWKIRASTYIRFAFISLENGVGGFPDVLGFFVDFIADLFFWSCISW